MSLRYQLGNLILYGKRTPPESMVMMNGRVQVWVRDDREEAWQIMDKIVAALAPDVGRSQLVWELDDLKRELDFKKKALRNCREAHLEAAGQIGDLRAEIERLNDA